MGSINSIHTLLMVSFRIPFACFDGSFSLTNCGNIQWTLCTSRHSAHPCPCQSLIPPEQLSPYVWYLCLNICSPLTYFFQNQAVGPGFNFLLCSHLRWALKIVLYDFRSKEGLCMSASLVVNILAYETPGIINMWAFLWIPGQPKPKCRVFFLVQQIG